MRRNPGGPLSLLLAAVLALCALPAAATDDFTFLLISDPHVGSQNPKAVPPVTPQDTERQVREARELLLPLAQAPYPARGLFRDRKPAPVPAEVRGLLIAGDLTDGAPERAAVQAQWKTFEDTPPADLRSFDVLSAGRLAWVLRIQDGEFLAMHHNGREWTNDPGLMLAKPLRPSAAPIRAVAP